jgi:hypothetical protein
MPSAVGIADPNPQPFFLPRISGPRQHMPILFCPRPPACGETNETRQIAEKILHKRSMQKYFLVLLP